MPSTRTHAPRGALVFDMRQLGRQAGSALTQTRIVPAPDDLRLELIGVPAGADVPLEVRFEAVSEGVLATGTAIAPLAGECARCLAPLTSSVTVGFQELYLYAEGRHDKHDKHDKHDEQEEQDAGELYHLDGDLLDLEPAFRDAVVLALPMSPLCREDCPGLCAECGAPLADAGPGPPARCGGRPEVGGPAAAERAGQRQTSGPARRRHRPTGGLTWRFPSGGCPAVTPDRDVRTGRPPRLRW